MIILVEATPQIEQHLTANMNISKKDIIIGNFLGGMFWGIGSVVGAGVVVALIGFTLKSLGVFDAIGSLFSQLNNLNQQMQQVPKLPNL